MDQYVCDPPVSPNTVSLKGKINVQTSLPC